MTLPDHGVDLLLRRATDGLRPDVDHLVAGGIIRGRTRQRRARIGTAVASLAVIGVVGVVAAVTPHGGGADSAPDPGIATDGTSETESITPSPTAQERLRDVPAAQIPTIVEGLLGTGASRPLSQLDIHLDEPTKKFVQFRYDGMVTDIGMQKDDQPSLSDCRKEAEGLDGSCQELPTGAVLLTWGPTLADGVTCQGADLERSGFDVWATSCNAEQGKDSPPLSAEPPLSLEQLIQVVANDYWFE